MSLSDAIGEYCEMYLSGDYDNAIHGLLEMTPAILPDLMAAYRVEHDTQIRLFLLNVIWEYRDQSVIPLLGEALFDLQKRIWQEALDGLVALASPTAVDALRAARNRQFTTEHDTETFGLWLAEAIEQAEQAVLLSAATVYMDPGILADAARWMGWHISPMVGLIFTGGRASAEVPAAFAPRNCGQFGAGDSAEASAMEAASSSAVENDGFSMRRMFGSSSRWSARNLHAPAVFRNQAIANGIARLSRFGLW